MDIIKEEAFRRQIKKGLSGGYLFFGEEDYLKSFSINAARSAVCSDETFAVFNDVRIDPLDYSAAALSSALMPPPMMADQKIITVNGLALCDLKPSELEELYDALSALPEYDYNVLIISVPSGLMDEGSLPKKPSAILSELSKYLTPVHFEAISGSRLTAWVGKHFEHHGATASPAVCAMLIDRCGKSMFTLASETEKISFYVLSHGRQEVTEDDVRNISASVIDSDAFALTNAILDGKYAEAIDALQVMKFRRIEPVIILSEITKTVCDLLCVKLMQQEGASIQEMTRALRQKSDYRTRIYTQAASGKSEEKLRQALLLCSEADLSLKLSSIDGYTLIERLVCHL